MNKSFALMCSFALLAALYNPLAADPEQEAGEILNRLSEKYGSYKTIRADFRYRIETRDEEEMDFDAEGEFMDERNGTIYLKGDKFRLDLGQQEVITDNESVWTHIKEAREVQINNFDRDMLEIHPSEIFHIYEEDYRYVHVGNRVEEGRVYDVVELTPKDRDDMIFKVRLYVDKSSGEIRETKIFEKTGLLYTYEISNFEPDVTMEDSFFRFNEDEHPDVTVVDLR